MQAEAAVTVQRSREELERLWNSSEDRPQDATVTFADAPGDRGTEIHVSLAKDTLVQKLAGGAELAKVKDALRRFKQRVEAGEIPRSDATPEGESAGRKFRQRPAQPLERAVAR
jgi:uncharacterized membrane protein